jgi:hypothetical protein
MDKRPRGRLSADLISVAKGLRRNNLYKLTLAAMS